MCGLIERDFYYIHKAIDAFPEIEKAVLFGSRALGNYKRGSDVDIALLGKSVSPHTVAMISDYLNEEYPLPYMFDIVHYEALSNAQLKEHIDKYGKILNYSDQITN
ncbi:hypothetical protein JNUCC1_01386 [Lentibacillus sp. JNUCC-1]|uniref:nucleotidyltransferase family protein n=1 Tax=Lentibacillus sp. JNUCC-1 TaxID=2654513 RepID=UPI0012E8697E|nr:nucleotidyltransferase domain-containing protein [Lentibacillus sp. JNUCC-1]MUV37580.1 hypothetical protein [Lentibacillus sp. JNUCC-1]